MSLHTAALLFALHCLLPSGTAYSCRRVSGGLVQIDAGGGQVFGVSHIDAIFTLYGNTWTRLPGELRHVTVGPAGVWGVSKDKNIFKLVGANWVSVPGILTQIDAGGNMFVAGANHQYAIYCLPTTDTIGYLKAGSDANWLHIPGGLKYYSCGPYNCWGVNQNDQIFVRRGVNSTNCQGTDPWKSISGSLSMIEVGGDGSVYGVNSGGRLYRRDFTSACTPEGNGWTYIPLYAGHVKHVSYDAGHLWLILKNNHIYDCTV